MAHVLVVDDDEDIRFSIRTLLESIGGHTVDEAADGRAALDLLRLSPEPLVVLLDLLMPGMDGVAVLQAVAADELLATRHAYMLITVSQRAYSPEFNGTLALAVPVVPKPFDIHDLLRLVGDLATQLGESPSSPPAAPPSLV